MTRNEGRRERKRRQTADKLAETAWTMFEKQGFENVTMEAIADQADVAKGTLYKHFPLKEALLQHYFHNELQREIPLHFERLEQIPAGEQRMRAFFEFSAVWSERRRAYIPHYLHFRMNSGVGVESNRSGTDRIFATLIETGIKSGEFRNDLPLDCSVHYLSLLYLGALLRWLHTPGRALIDELDTMLELFLNGIRSKT